MCNLFCKGLCTKIFNIFHFACPNHVYFCCSRIGPDWTTLYTPQTVSFIYNFTFFVFFISHNSSGNFFLKSYSTLRSGIYRLHRPRQSSNGKVYIRVSVTLCSNYEGLTLHVETVESITNDHPTTAQNMVSAACAI